MSKNTWFRMYGDFINNPKVLILTEALRYRYVALLCLQCNGDYENRPNDEIALSLRVTVEDWILTRDEFVKRELLTPDYKIKGWKIRQYVSDLKDSTAAERQKRYRERRRNDRNDTVTSRLPEADTDTDTEKKEKKVVGTRFALQHPPVEWIAYCEMQRPDLNAREVFEGFRDYWIAKAGKDSTKADWLATWRNWIRNQKTKTGGNYGNTKSKFQIGIEGLAAAKAKRIARTAGQAGQPPHGLLFPPENVRTCT